MSARIPHLLTRLLNSDELDALEEAMIAKADAAKCDAASFAWAAAIMMIREHRESSFQRRANQTPSARRKSLSRRF